MAGAQEDEYRAEFARQAERIGVVALGAGYVRGSGEPVVMTAGVLKTGSSNRVAGDALWHIGSISKSFTAALLMRLAEQKELEFDAPLEELLPDHAAEMHPDWRAITLPQLLSHTSGMRANFTTRQMVEESGDDRTADRLRRLRQHWRKPLPKKPGQFLYSNMGYVLAGLVAEISTGTSWEELIMTQIAAPLGLTTIGFGAPQGAQAPWGHKSKMLFLKRPVDPASRWSDNPPWLGPAGTLHMSLADLVAWGRAHMLACRGEMAEFLSRKRCERLHEPVAGDYAMGWIVSHLSGRPEIVHSHDGSNTMWYATLAYAPDKDVVMALVMNEFSPRKSAKAAMALATILLDNR